MSNFQKNSKDYGEPDITYQLAGCADKRGIEGKDHRIMGISKASSEER